MKPIILDTGIPISKYGNCFGGKLCKVAEMAIAELLVGRNATLEEEVGDDLMVDQCALLANIVLDNAPDYILEDDTLITEEMDNVYDSYSELMGDLMDVIIMAGAGNQFRVNSISSVETIEFNGTLAFLIKQ